MRITLSLLASLALAGCLIENPESSAQDPLLTLAKGTQSGVSSARMQVVYTQAEFIALWAEHDPTSPAPDVDLGGYMVAAVFQGGAPNSGYDIEILRARALGGVLEVAVRQRQPGATCATLPVVTTPFHIVVLPRSDLPVLFDSTTEVTEC